MALLENLPKELSLIINFYQNPLKCYGCQKISFEGMNHIDSEEKSCLTCLTRCNDCNVFILNDWWITGKNNIKMDNYDGYYFNGINCDSCYNEICFQCASETGPFTNIISFKNYICRQCAKLCRNNYEYIK